MNGEKMENGQKNRIQIREYTGAKDRPKKGLKDVKKYLRKRLKKKEEKKGFLKKVGGGMQGGLRKS